MPAVRAYALGIALLTSAAAGCTSHDLASYQVTPSGSAGHASERSAGHGRPAAAGPRPAPTSPGAAAARHQASVVRGPGEHTASASASSAPRHHHRGWKVRTVPATIPHDCSSAVDKRLTHWLASVPRRSVVRFRAGGCYGQDGTISVTDRRLLILDGNGAHFRALTPGMPLRANWRLIGVHHVVLKRMNVVGANAAGTTRRASYNPALEWQAGYAIAGGADVTLDHVTASDVWGDGVYVGPDSRRGSRHMVPSRRVLVTHSRVRGTGRHGIGLTDVSRFVLRRSSVALTRWEGVDIEPGAATEVARHIDILRNTFAGTRLGMVANWGAGAAVSDIRISGNTERVAPQTCQPSVSISAPADARRQDYVITNNKFFDYTTAVRATGVDNLRVARNTVASDAGDGGCGTRAGVVLAYCRGVVVRHNDFGRNNDQAVALRQGNQQVHTSNNQP